MCDKVKGREGKRSCRRPGNSPCVSPPVVPDLSIPLFSQVSDAATRLPKQALPPCLAESFRDGERDRGRRRRGTRALQRVGFRDVCKESGLKRVVVCGQEEAFRAKSR